MNLEQELKPPQSLEKALEDRGIRGLLFDLDNTVFETDTYYITKKDKAYLEVATKFPYKNLSPIETAQKVSDEVHRKFLERNCKPLPVIVEYEEGLKDFYGSGFNEGMSEILNTHFKDFYNNSPEIYPEAIPLFDFFFRYQNISFFAANTLADIEWTQIKIDRMKKEFGLTDLPFFTTDIDKPKDWKIPVKEALSRGLDLQELLVIGDSLDSDILPAISSGVKHLIWIDRRGKFSQLENLSFEDLDLQVVNSISDIWNIK